jgi:hypothetical protein
MRRTMCVLGVLKWVYVVMADEDSQEKVDIIQWNTYMQVASQDKIVHFGLQYCHRVCLQCRVTRQLPHANLLVSVVLSFPQLGLRCYRQTLVVTSLMLSVMQI